MTGTDDEGYESWMDEVVLTEETAHPSNMPKQADTASKRSRDAADTTPPTQQAATNPNSTQSPKKSKPSGATQTKIQFSQTDASKAANSNSPTPAVVPAAVAQIPSDVGMMSRQGTSDSRQAAKNIS